MDFLISSDLAPREQSRRPPENWRIGPVEKSSGRNIPRLGLYDGIARLLKQGPDFLDQASSQRVLGCTVWDVAFGSVFPCANAAAREMFTALVKKRQTVAINVERWLQ